MLKHPLTIVIASVLKKINKKKYILHKQLINTAICTYLIKMWIGTS